MSLQEKLEALKDQTLAKIEEVTDLAVLNQIRVETLGKKVRLQKYYAG